MHGMMRLSGLKHYDKKNLLLLLLDLYIMFFFVLGNKNLMKCDKVWKELLEHYGRQGCVVDAECVKSRRHKKKHKQKEASKEEFYS